jgi:hypothetical protein
MARESPAQQGKVAEVMHEFKHGELKSSTGKKVRNPKQAVAIGLSEAGASRKQSSGKKGRATTTTKSGARPGKQA